MGANSWLPMRSAPKDGTMILVTETPNAEHWNVVPASWMAYGRTDDPDNSKHGGWWGVDASRYTNEGPLYTKFKPLACTPICWMPFPEAEDIGKLRRRAGQIYSAESRAASGKATQP